MNYRFLIGLLVLSALPFLQACEDRQVAGGAAVVSTVGGSIGAITAGSGRGAYSDPYYRNRFDNYYRNRGGYYDSNYGGIYSRRDYRPVTEGYRYRRDGSQLRRIGGYSVSPGLALQSTALLSSRGEAQALQGFFELPPASAAILLDAKNRARQGDLRGLKALGLGRSDFSRMANGSRLSGSTIRVVAASLGIVDRHAADILRDFQSEFAAQVRAGRIRY